jgi:hypothetical protein
MKKFKEFLKENDKNKEDTKALKSLMSLNAGYSWIQRPEDSPYTRGDLSMFLAKQMDQPSMAAHKAWNTDVGVAFNQDPTTGELYADPEGFMVVHKRTREGRNVKFKEFDYEKYRSGLINRLTFGLLGKPEDDE